MRLAPLLLDDSNFFQDMCMNSSSNFQSTNYVLVASALPRLNAFPELISELVDGFFCRASFEEG
jgi:hypothetical protein